MPAQKTIEIDREKIISIFSIILARENGASVFIPCASKKEQRDAHTCIIRELKILSEIDPNDAASITHRTIFKDGRFWVVLTKVEPSLSAIYVKGADKKLTKVDI